MRSIVERESFGELLKFWLMILVKHRNERFLKLEETAQSSRVLETFADDFGQTFITSFLTTTTTTTTILLLLNELLSNESVDARIKKFLASCPSDPRFPSSCLWKQKTAFQKRGYKLCYEKVEDMQSMAKKIASSPARSHVNPRILRFRCRARSDDEASDGFFQSMQRFRTSDSVHLNVRKSLGVDDQNEIAIVCLHGSYHASWCYEEHFFAYFMERGVDSYAIDFRAHGSSEIPVAAKKTGVAGTFEEHARDVMEFVDVYLGNRYEKVFLVGHSFGGLVAQEVFANDLDSKLSGLILLASVPFNGNADMVKRFLKTDVIKSFKITYAFIVKLFGTDQKSCRECFFSKTMSEEEVVKYMRLIDTSSKARLLDLKKLNESLPIKKKKKKNRKEVLVIGGKDDYVVDIIGIEETAKFYDTEPIIIEDLAHDVMLDTNWESVAKSVYDFVK